MARSVVSLDFETFSEEQLVGPSSVGLWNYSTALTTEALMVAYKIDTGPIIHCDLTQEVFPPELREALLDPEVEKWAFNAGFERVITRNTLGIATPYKGWRCTMALAALQSFAGDLGTVGAAMGLPADKLKDKEGSRLIKLFCGLQKITRKNSLYRRDRKTDPDDWIKLCDYNTQDVVAEDEIKRKLAPYAPPDEEWALYELDQKINDEGMPVNERFVRNADILSMRRKAELRSIMSDLTGLHNPNSTQQILPWLTERGYPFSDLQKNTVRKVLTDNKEDTFLNDEAVQLLKLRQQASRTSVRKYPAILRRVSVDGRMRHCFQFAGAARTARWSGRGPQPHNLVKTPAVLEAEDDDDGKLVAAAEAIEAGDYDTLELLTAEPMVALAGSLRSSFQAQKGHILVVSDLSAIESAVTAWISGCERLLAVFRDKRDPYRDFGVELYRIAYDQITKAQRTICKPAVLGCSYQLGGGELKQGKRTGLWGYAENMGVNITKEEAHRQVALFREIYFEIVETWRRLEEAAARACRGLSTTVGNGLLHFEKRGPYVTVTLPNRRRRLHYYRGRMVDRKFDRADGSSYTRRVFSYMGQNQVTRQWGRVYSSGGKLLENVVQATSRDILGVGMLRADAQGFPIVGSVHDEIIAMVREGDNRLTLPLLRDCMMAPIDWAEGLPLGAAGYVSRIYRKD